MFTCTHPSNLPLTVGKHVLWYIDSGAGKCISGDESLFTSITPLQPTSSVKFGDGKVLSVTGAGPITLFSEYFPEGMVLPEVLFVQGCMANLLSVHSTATALGCTLSFDEDGCLAHKDNRPLWYIPVSKHGVYSFHANKSDVPPITPALQFSLVDGDPLTNHVGVLWHKRLGHPSYDILADVIAQELVEGLPISGKDLSILHQHMCEGCLTGKAVRSTFPNPHISANIDNRVAESQAPLHLVHVDLMGPFTPVGLPNSQKYILSIVDDFSRYGEVVTLSRKSDASTALQTALIKWMARLNGMQLCYVRSDRGGEFMNTELQNWLKDRGVVQQFSQAYTPQQNGVAERFNGVVSNKARVLMLDSHLPAHFWPYAYRVAAHTRNMLPTSSRSQTPYQLFYNKKPDVASLRVFGSHCVVTLVSKSKRKTKMDPRGVLGRFVGYSEYRGFLVWVPTAHQVVESADVRFLEHLPLSSIPGQIPYDGAPLSLVEDQARAQPAPQDNVGKAAFRDLMVVDQLRGMEVATPEPSLVQPPTSPNEDTSEPAKSLDSTPTTTNELPDLPSPPPSSAGAPSHPDDPVLSSTTIPEGWGAAHPGTEFTNPLFDSEQEGAQRIAVRQSRRLCGQQPEYPGLLSGASTKVESCVDAVGNSDQLGSDMDVFEGLISLTLDLDYKSAIDLTNPDRDKWLLALRDEYESLVANGTWTLVPRQPHMRVLPAKWVFNHKLGSDGAIERYKCRLVAKGFRQRPGQDFLDVYAPVTARSTVRVLLAAAVHKKMYLRQLDIKTAFLNGVLEEDIYMSQPEGFECGDGSMVCKLQRSIYGLKQAPRAWHNTLKKVLLQIGFRSCRADPAIFARREADGTYSYINTYVDDFLIAVLQLSIYEEILQAMRAAKWEVKELGIPTQYLSLDMEVKLDSDGRCVQITLCQKNAIDTFLTKLKLANVTPCTTPMEQNWDHDAFADSSPRLPTQNKYASMIGMLIYLAVCTRPDIAYAVSTLSRYTAAPLQADLKAATRVFGYLKKTRNMGLCFSREADSAPSSPLPIFAYSDASYAEDHETRRSQTGTAIQICGGFVLWNSKRQVTTAVSSAEAEYQALSSTVKEAMWVKSLLLDLGLYTGPFKVLVDNTSTISWATEFRVVSRAKHIDVMHHYVQDVFADKRLLIDYVPSSDQLADPLTKALGRTILESFLPRMGMVLHG